MNLSFHFVLHFLMSFAFLFSLLSFLEVATDTIIFRHYFSVYIILIEFNYVCIFSSLVYLTYFISLVYLILISSIASCFNNFYNVDLNVLYFHIIFTAIYIHATCLSFFSVYFGFNSSYKNSYIISSTDRPKWTGLFIIFRFFIYIANKFTKNILLYDILVLTSDNSFFRWLW